MHTENNIIPKIKILNNEVIVPVKADNENRIENEIQPDVNASN